MLSREHTLWARYLDKHLVSINGDVISVGGQRASKLLTPKVSNWGYLRVGIYNKGTQNTKRVRVHRMVMLGFYLKDQLKQVNHKDGNKLNNRVENLEWSTQSSNQKHAFRSGLNKASTAPKPTLRALDDKQVNLAIEFHQQGLSNVAVGEKLGVSSTTVSRILNGGYAVCKSQHRKK